MVQVLKDTVREQIAEAAKRRFADVGFCRATVGSIAREAGFAAGTVYKYFENKEALFESIITDAFVDEYLRLTRNRIASFAASGGMDTDVRHKGGASGELLRFLVNKRFEVIIILSRAKGTRFESFVHEYIGAMEEQSLKQAREQYPQLESGRTFRFMVRSILKESVRFMVSILEEFEDRESIEAALMASAKYQLAGIRALVEA